jgi:indole-3-glycerol phosphate synthase
MERVRGPGSSGLHLSTGLPAGAIIVQVSGWDLRALLERKASSYREQAQGERLEDAPVACDAPAPPSVKEAIRAARHSGLVPVIAEFKRRSPSEGDIRPLATVEEVVRSYAEGGACAVSVLTEREWFGGSREDLRKAVAASCLPCLRKDFVIFEEEVLEARKDGASAVLLVVRALALLGIDLAPLVEAAHRLGLEAIVEVANERELLMASEQLRTVGQARGSVILGVNRRDLVRLTVSRGFDVGLARVAKESFPEAPVVLESGVTGPEDARAALEAGYDAVLVGTALMRSSDPRSAVAALVGALKGIPTDPQPVAPA